MKVIYMSNNKRIFQFSVTTEHSAADGGRCCGFHVLPHGVR